MAERRFGAERLGLALFQIAAVWATASARRLPILWALILPSLVALGTRVGSPPPALLRGVARATSVIVGLMLTAGTAWMLYPLVSDELVARVGLVAGLLLLACASVLGFGLRSVPPARAALPAALGALLAAALEPRATLTGPLALATLAAALMLAADAPRASLLRVAPVLGVAAGLALGVMHFLPWAQPLVESRVAATLNADAFGTTGFGGDSNLGEIEALAESQRPALRVYADRELKLRARVCTRFDGRRWEVGPQTAAPAVALRGEIPPRWPKEARGQWRTRPGAGPEETAQAGLQLSVIPIFDQVRLFVPAHLQAVRVANERLAWSVFGTVASDAAAQAYDLVASEADAGLGVPGVGCEACLDLPPRLDPRLLELARSLAAGATTPQERVARTLRHLDTTCRYSLEPGRFRTADPLAEFLFEKRRGYCEYFATAAAMLLRLEGLPTRYVRGFNVTAERRAGDHYLVREADAHAWIDVFLPAAGWVEVDPTPAAEYATLHPAHDGRLALLSEWLAARWARLRLALGSGALVGWAAVGLLALLLLGNQALRWLRRLRTRRGPGRAPAIAALRPELRALVRCFDQQCTRRGAPRPAARGLIEHVDSLGGERFPAAWRAASRAAAECVYAEVYAGRPAAVERLRALSAELVRR